MASTDQEYYRQRAIKARSMAAASTDPAARRAQLTLAERYQRIADGEPHVLRTVMRG